MSAKMKKMKPKGSWKLDDRKLAVIAMVMVVSVALTLGIVFFTRGNNSSSGKDAKTVAQAEDTEITAVSYTLTGSVPSIEELSVPALSIVHERNIFKPLIDMAAEGGESEGSGAGGQAGGWADSGSSSGSLSSGPVWYKVNTDGSGGGIAAVAVTLEGVIEEEGNEYAQIRVAGQLFGKVAEGEVFGDYYKLLNIESGEVVDILYGDEKFTIGIGQSIYW